MEKCRLSQLQTDQESYLQGTQRTSRPIVTGQSVIAVRYQDGIMMAADTQCKSVSFSFNFGKMKSRKTMLLQLLGESTGVEVANNNQHHITDHGSGLTRYFGSLYLRSFSLLVCYGNQKKFKDIGRIFSLDQSNVLVGFSGEYSDAQHILKLLTDLE